MVHRFYGGPIGGETREIDGDLAPSFCCQTWEAPPEPVRGLDEPATEIAGMLTTHYYDFKHHSHHGWGYYYREQE
jgi:hypothetical protein